MHQNSECLRVCKCNVCVGGWGGLFACWVGLLIKMYSTYKMGKKTHYLCLWATGVGMSRRAILDLKSSISQKAYTSSRDCGQVGASWWGKHALRGMITLEPNMVVTLKLKFTHSSVAKGDDHQNTEKQSECLTFFSWIWVELQSVYWTTRSRQHHSQSRPVFTPSSFLFLRCELLFFPCKMPVTHRDRDVTSSPWQLFPLWATFVVWDQMLHFPQNVFIKVLNLSGGKAHEVTVGLSQAGG